MLWSSAAFSWCRRAQLPDLLALRLDLPPLRLDLRLQACAVPLRLAQRPHAVAPQQQRRLQHAAPALRQHAASLLSRSHLLPDLLVVTTVRSEFHPIGLSPVPGEYYLMHKLFLLTFYVSL